MRLGAPRPVVVTAGAAACLLAYAVADALISALVHAGGSISSWEGVSAFTAMFSAIALLASLIPLSLLLERRQAAGASKRPDYSAIARMEREVYGETFKHEGAPASVQPAAKTAPKATGCCSACETSLYGLSYRSTSDQGIRDWNVMSTEATEATGETR